EARATGSDGALAEPGGLADEAADRHRRAEDARPETADGGFGVQPALKEERAPALDPALADEGRRADQPDHEQRALDPDRSSASAHGGSLAAPGPAHGRPAARDCTREQ